MSIIERVKKAGREVSEKWDRHRLKNLGHKDRWPVDRDDAMIYFIGRQGLENFVRTFLNKRQEDGLVTNHLDIAGRATFSPLLVQESVLFARSNLGQGNDISKQYIEGDVMNEKEFNFLLDHISRSGLRFQIITFNPVGGLGEYDPLLVGGKARASRKKVEGALFNVFLRRLTAMIKFLDSGGILFLGESHLLAQYYVDNEKQFRNLFDRLGLEVLFDPDQTDPVFLLRKK